MFFYSLAKMRLGRRPIKGLEQYITKAAVFSDGYVIGDRYFDYNIKSET